jgi:2-keto-4-pentenoate hydratase/2-oxohepta-3-ene-1,7-dioic acid hydratase in catechol pathway
MRYVSFEHRGDNRQSWGVQVAELIVDLPPAGEAIGTKFPATLMEFIQEGPAAWGRAAAAVETFRARHGVGRALAPDDVRLLAPLSRPSKNVFALGLNYADHVAEAGEHEPLPQVPIYFTKASSAINGPDHPVIADPRLTTKLDWEVELGVVIGVGGRWIARERALEHVFGYTVINDLSARDLQHDRPAGQWFLGKSLDGCCPMGPALVSADEIPDPQRLDLTLRVNGIEKQRSNTRHMIFGVAEIIADLSRYITLAPGDIISTGTPSGVGDARTPPEFLRPGDVVEAEIAPIGVLRTPVTGPVKG